MDKLGRIILDHKCVCRILLKKVKKYSTYIIKIDHVYCWCVILISLQYRRSWLKGQIHTLTYAFTLPSKRLAKVGTIILDPGPWYKDIKNIKIWSYQYWKSHCGDKTILRPSYLHNGISYTVKAASLYCWIGAQGAGCVSVNIMVSKT